MPVTFENMTTGQRVSCPAPDDAPVRRQQPRARRIAQFDASDDWERVGVTRIHVDAADDSADTPADESTVETVDEPSAAEVRAWAQEQGIEMSPRGKLPAGVVEGYKQAHAG